MSKYAGRAAGSFGALGGELEFVWVPSPEEVANDILQVANYLDDMLGPLTLSKAVAREDVSKRFRYHEDPDGNPWTDWSESYQAYALRHNMGGVLEQSMRMEEAATSDRAFVIGDDMVFFDTSVFRSIGTKSDPEGDRWIWHQEGRERGGKAPTAEEIASEAKFLGVTHNVAKITLQARSGGGASNDLPARPFLGLSFEAEISIVEIWDQWFDGAIDIGISAKGKTFPRHAKRGAGGRFIPKQI